MTTFYEMGLEAEILQALEELHFHTPTPIQEKTIPLLLTSQEDIIALAQTGTGKTAAFGIPAVQLAHPKDRVPKTLVLAPTRELCVQISKDIKALSKHKKGISVLPVYGGAPIDTQLRALKRGVQIVVATPGRARDLINRGALQLHLIERVVLDEADEMLTMGFREELEDILSHTPDTKQTLLFSATMSQGISAITRRYMNNPTEIAVDRKNSGADHIEHHYYFVRSSDKYEVLKRIADMHPTIYGIIFCRTRRETREVADRLEKDGYNTKALHGDLSQAARDEVMAAFRNRRVQLLVATDVAARGIDVSELSHIIHFSLPDDPEMYLHRSGRTGRAGKSGVSIAIIHTRERGKLREISRAFSITFEKKMVPTGKEICTKQLYALIDRVENTIVDDTLIAPFLPEIYRKLEWMSREELIQRFVYIEFNRFLGYYKNARDINIPEKRTTPARQTQPRGRENFTTVSINVGYRQNITPARIIGLINEALSSRRVSVGRIDIKETRSFVDVDPNFASALVELLEGYPIAGVPLHIEITTQNNRGQKNSHPRNSGSTRRSDKKRNNKKKEYRNRKP